MRPLVAGVVGVVTLAVLRIRVRSYACEERRGHSRSRSVHRRKALEPERERSCDLLVLGRGRGRVRVQARSSGLQELQQPRPVRAAGRGRARLRGKGDCKGKSKGPATKYSWRIDLTAPTTTITEKPSRPTAETNADFSFTANEEVERFECKLDDGQFAECISPMSFVSLEEGKHKFAVRAIDLAGNVGNAERHQWRISTEQTTVVPDVVGMQSAQGIEVLEAAQLEWQEEQIASPEPVGQIVEQNSAAGEEVPVGTTVTVVISAGIEITVPSVLDWPKKLQWQGSRRPVLWLMVARFRAGSRCPAGPGDTVEITVSLGSSVPGARGKGGRHRPMLARRRCRIRPP